MFFVLRITCFSVITRRSGDVTGSKSSLEYQTERVGDPYRPNSARRISDLEIPTGQARIPESLKSCFHLIEHEVQLLLRIGLEWLQQ